VTVRRNPIQYVKSWI